MYRYSVRKVFEDLGSVAYRQHKADTFCNLLHGYSLSFEFEFSSNELDVRDWLVDFSRSGLGALKDKLEEWFDHTLLVGSDDPHREILLNLGSLGIAKPVILDKVSSEGIADFLVSFLNGPTGFLRDLGYPEHIVCSEVVVREKRSSWAVARRDVMDYSDIVDLEERTVVSFSGEPIN